MALHKENYGLIYNDDGSLCATLRKDDVPFEGVTSFAVEEGTTNLFSNPIFADGTFNGYDFLQGWTTNEIKDGGPFGKYAELYTANGFAGIGAWFNINAGETYAFSVYVKVLEWDQRANAQAEIVYYDASNTVLSFTSKKIVEIPSTNNAKDWTRFSMVLTAPAGATKARVDIWIGGTTMKLQTTGFQFEQKPFATSFVVGSRPSGRLVIPVEDLKFDIANDDWVISYWKYPVATSDGTQNRYNTCSLGQYTSDNSKGYIWWGKESSINKYRLNVILNDATGIQNISANTFNPTDYFYHWHFEVMKKQGKVLSYYVDGVKQCELIIPADKEIQTPFDVGLSLGGSSGSYPNNALIANLLIARYDPAIWTAEYIQELYNMRRPFSIPPKLPII